MILFQDDWALYPTAIIDYNTKNETFKRLAALYHRMGIKNAGFLLALLQPDLQGVDPFDPNLTVEQMTMIAVECRYNPWYFFREVVRIPPVSGPIPGPFKANRGNIALIWSFFCSIDIALIQPRQTGKSVSTDTLMIYLLHIGTSNTLINMVTKDDKLRKENVERLKKIRDLLPAYLVPKTRKDTDNQDELTCYSYGNRYRTGVAQASETAANNLGRGVTSPINHVDEGPFISWIGVTLPALLASGNAARAEAKCFGRPYGNIFTTTAGKKDDRDGRYMYDLISQGAPWNEAFFDCKNKEDLEQVVNSNLRGDSKNKKTIINATFSHRQLGLTDAWLAEALANANAKGDAADRDFFNVWTAGTQRSPLSIALNEIIRKSIRDPEHSEITNEGYIIRWYIRREELDHAMNNSYYVLSMDTSEAVNRDAITGTIINMVDLSVVGAFSINETNLIRCAKFVGDMLIRYKRITLIPERKSSGQTFIDSLLLQLPLAGEDPFKRIFNTIADESTVREDEYRAICGDMNRRNSQFYDQRKKYFGFNTNAQSRELLYTTILQDAAKRAGDKVKDKLLAEEILGLVEKNGRIDHVSSGHDDMVIAWLLGNWFITNAKNLKHYDIDVTKVDNIRVVDGSVHMPEQTFEDLEQLTLMREAQSLLKDLEETENEFLIRKIEHRLRIINGRVKQSEDETFSIDALINKAKEKRAENSRVSVEKIVDRYAHESKWLSRYRRAA